MKKALIITTSILTLALLMVGGVIAYTTLVQKRPISSLVQNPFVKSGAREVTTSRTGSSTLSIDTKKTPAENQPVSKIFQLSTRPQVGAVLFERDTAPFVRYVEKGTGHIYELDITTRKEARISNTTLGQTIDAVFSPQGTRVAITHMDGASTEIMLGAIVKNDKGETSFVGAPLPRGAQNPGFDSTGEKAYFALKTNAGTDGYERDLKTGVETKIFSTPLRSVDVTWLPRPIITTKPSFDLFGASYLKDGSRLAAGRGLMVLGSKFSTSTLVFDVKNGKTYSRFQVASTSQIVNQTLIPLKCDFESSDEVICGIPTASPSRDFPDAWLMGEEKFADDIYRVNVETGEKALIVSPKAASGRAVDITDMQTYKNRAIFSNKLDDSLWSIMTD